MTDDEQVDALPVLRRATLGIELAAIGLACDIALIGDGGQQRLDRTALFGWALPAIPAPTAPNPLCAPVNQFRYDVRRIAVRVRERLADRAPDLPSLVNMSRQVVDLRGRLSRDEVLGLGESDRGRGAGAAHEGSMTVACGLTWDEAGLLTGHTVTWRDSGSPPVRARIVHMLPSECVLVELVDNPDGQTIPVHPADLS